MSAEQDADHRCQRATVLADDPSGVSQDRVPVVAIASGAERTPSTRGSHRRSRAQLADAGCRGSGLDETARRKPMNVRRFSNGPGPYEVSAQPHSCNLVKDDVLEVTVFGVMR